MLEFITDSETVCSCILAWAWDTAQLVEGLLSMLKTHVLVPAPHKVDVVEYSSNPKPGIHKTLSVKKNPNKNQTKQKIPPIQSQHVIS